jgi:DNA-binding NarL/FixJ family response regulator
MDKSAHIKIHPVYQFFYADLHSQILLELHQYDSSAYYIRQARDMLDKDTMGLDRGWYGILEGNLAKIHYYKKEYPEAIPLLLNAVTITNQAHLYDVTASFGLKLVNCYIQVNQIDRIKAVFPVIRKAVYLQSKDVHYIDLYKMELALQGETYSPKRKLQLLDSIDIRKQNLAKLHDRNLLTKNEMEAEMVAFQERQTAMADEINRQLLWRNLLWGSLGLALLIAYYIFYHGNKRFRQERKRTEEIQVQSEQELNEARKQLLQFATTLQDKSSQIEQLESNLEANQQLDSLEQLRQNSILTDADWVIFKSLFEKVHPGFFALIKNKFPSLTTGELRFLTLVKLSFTTKEMASTLGVSPGSVRSIRSRLLKKLDLVENENLGQLISAL